MSTLFFSEVDTYTPQPDDVAAFDKARNVTVQTHGDLHGTKPRPYSTLRNIIFSGQRYQDKVASCACATLELYKFGDEAYTRCAEHGVQAIGMLRRDVAKAVRR